MQNIVCACSHFLSNSDNDGASFITTNIVAEKCFVLAISNLLLILHYFENRVCHCSFIYEAKHVPVVSAGC